MDRLRELVGIERSVTGVSQALHLLVSNLAPPVVGAMHITCADESEAECVNAFHQGFARYYLPSLKLGEHAAFRIANLGGRYEWSAIRIAEDHYASPKSHDAYKLLVVKVNAHVAAVENSDGYQFGVMKRYDRDSACCGALQALLQGSHQPFVDQLHEAFTSEGLDRVSALRDERVVAAEHRSLFAAIVSARLQARRVVLDIQDYEPKSPTKYLVVPCVTLNRPGPDSELVCGYYWASDQFESQNVEHFGLGDDPAGYELAFKNGRVVVTDEHLGAPRRARDHRQLVLEEWRKRAGKRRTAVGDDRLVQIRHDVEQRKHRDRGHSKSLLRGLLVVLAEVEPVSAAVLLFANGMMGIHHAFRVHRMARELEGSDEARKMLSDLYERIDHMDPEHAEAMVELLAREYRS
jgi:hypothetical protein